MPQSLISFPSLELDLESTAVEVSFPSSDYVAQKKAKIQGHINAGKKGAEKHPLTAPLVFHMAFSLKVITASSHS